jgi:hypothetical protein
MIMLFAIKPGEGVRTERATEEAVANLDRPATIHGECRPGQAADAKPRKTSAS